MKKKDLEELFCFKIGRELDQFKEKIRRYDLEEILARAYQVDTMISIYELLMEMCLQMEKEALESLILFPDVLTVSYNRWMNQEDTHMLELQNSVIGTVREIQDYRINIGEYAGEENAA